jgi:hypothetical protein
LGQTLRAYRARDRVKGETEGVTIMSRYSNAKSRGIALSAVRGHARTINVNPVELSDSDAFNMLNELYLTDKELIASRFYIEASDNQVKLFKADWRQWLKEQAHSSYIYSKR